MERKIRTKSKVTISTKAGTLILAAVATGILYVGIFMGLFK